MSRVFNVVNGVIGLAVLGAQLLSFGQVTDNSRATTVMMGKRPLFQVIAGVGDKSAAERTREMQENLDSALHLVGPSCSVDIARIKGIPSITVGGRYVGAVDAVTATAFNQSPDELAANWAENIRAALKDPVAVNAELAAIDQTGDIVSYAATAAAAPVHFAQLPPGTELPVVPDTVNATDGHGVVAHLVADVKLPNGDTLSQNTKLYGTLVSGVPAFDSMELVDGTIFPISAETVKDAKGLRVRLRAPAQVAVSGGVL